MNYKIKTSNVTTEICSDTYRPMQTLPVSISLVSEVQHDGRSWTDEFVTEMERSLYADIMIELEDVVKNHIKNTKPFACHQFNESVLQPTD